jgi:hypothetical protein
VPLHAVERLPMLPFQTIHCIVHIYRTLVDQTPETHTNKYTSNTCDACLATLNAEHASALQDSRTLLLKLMMSREVAVSPETNKCCGTCCNPKVSGLIIKILSAYWQMGGAEFKNLPVTRQGVQSSAATRSSFKIDCKFSGCSR